MRNIRRAFRAATALVLGELGVRDADTAKALGDALEDTDPSVRLEVVRTVGKLRIEPALPRLLARIKEGGEEADAAAHAAAHLGAKGTRALQELMPKVSPGLRRYIASALAGGGTASATAAAAAVLLDKDPGVVEAAVARWPSRSRPSPHRSAMPGPTTFSNSPTTARRRSPRLIRRQWSVCWRPWTTRALARLYGKK